METTLGVPVLAAAILDRDYRSNEECNKIQSACEAFCHFVAIHRRKEIENFLLIPEAMDRALRLRLEDRANRAGSSFDFKPLAFDALNAFAEGKKAYVVSQIVSEARRFGRSAMPQAHETQAIESVYETFEAGWASFDGRMSAVPGKDALADFNKNAQEIYGSSVTPTAVIAAMAAPQVPEAIRELIMAIRDFSSTSLD
jgi:hypothetical protein